MEKTKYNPEIHHRKSIRLKGYDYSKEGLYFVTICTHNRENLFGEIKDGEMFLNEFGKIAEEKWFDLLNHIKNIELHEFVVMPNHIHGIIEICTIDIVGAGSKPAQYSEQKMNQESMVYSKPKSKTRTGLEPAPTGNVKLSEIVRQYKTFTAKQINKHRNIQGIPVWQRNYYENIIRNEEIYQRVSEYIKNNPQNWTDDKYYK